MNVTWFQRERSPLPVKEVISGCMFDGYTNRWKLKKSILISFPLEQVWPPLLYLKFVITLHHTRDPLLSLARTTPEKHLTVKYRSYRPYTRRQSPQDWTLDTAYPQIATCTAHSKHIQRNLYAHRTESKHFSIAKNVKPDKSPEWCIRGRRANTSISCNRTVLSRAETPSRRSERKRSRRANF